MPVATTRTTIEGTDKAVHDARRNLGPRLGGLAIASLVPALFWAAVIYFVSHRIGTPLSSRVVEMIGGAIALFLFVVCAPLMLRPDAERRAERPAYAPRRTSQSYGAFPLHPELQAQFFKRDI